MEVSGDAFPCRKRNQIAIEVQDWALGAQRLRPYMSELAHSIYVNLGRRKA
jgi:hypothetical protein